MDPSRDSRWRVHYITILMARMKLFNTKPGLTDVICRAIAEWFDTGTVTTEKYNEKYHPAIDSQSEIGWWHLFKGKISKECQTNSTRNLKYGQQQ